MLTIDTAQLARLEQARVRGHLRSTPAGPVWVAPHERVGPPHPDSHRGDDHYSAEYYDEEHPSGWSAQTTPMDDFVRHELGLHPNRLSADWGVQSYDLGHDLYLVDNEDDATYSIIHRIVDDPEDEHEPFDVATFDAEDFEGVRAAVAAVRRFGPTAQDYLLANHGGGAMTKGRPGVVIEEGLLDALLKGKVWVPGHTRKVGGRTVQVKGHYRTTRDRKTKQAKPKRRRAQEDEEATRRSADAELEAAGIRDQDAERDAERAQDADLKAKADRELQEAGIRDMDGDLTDEEAEEVRKETAKIRKVQAEVEQLLAEPLDETQRDERRQAAEVMLDRMGGGYKRMKVTVGEDGRASVATYDGGPSERERRRAEKAINGMFDTVEEIRGEVTGLAVDSMMNRIDAEAEKVFEGREKVWRGIRSTVSGALGAIMGWYHGKYLGFYHFLMSGLDFNAYVGAYTGPFRFMTGEFWEMFGDRLSKEAKKERSERRARGGSPQGTGIGRRRAERAEREVAAGIDKRDLQKRQRLARPRVERIVEHHAHHFAGGDGSFMEALARKAEEVMRDPTDKKVRDFRAWTKKTAGDRRKAQIRDIASGFQDGDIAFHTWRGGVREAEERARKDPLDRELFHDLIERVNNNVSTSGLRGRYYDYSGEMMEPGSRKPERPPIHGGYGERNAAAREAASRRQAEATRQRELGQRDRARRAKRRGRSRAR